MRRLAHGGAAGGFTLVELLLAITLMALLLGLAYGGLSAAGKASVRGQERLQESGRLRLAHQFVRRQLSQMLPLTFAYDEEDQAVVFDGGERFIQYVAPMPGYLGSGGPHVQRMELVDGPDGMELQFTHALMQGFEQDLLYERDAVVLLRGIEFARFAFLDRDPEGGPGSWVADWPQPETLPLAVSLDLDFGETAPITWPPLATGVRIDAMAISHASHRPEADNPIQEMLRRRGGTQQ